jgi:hypothetical protein
MMLFLWSSQNLGTASMPALDATILTSHRGTDLSISLHILRVRRRALQYWDSRSTSS